MSTLALLGPAPQHSRAAEGPPLPVAVTDANWVAIDAGYATHAGEYLSVAALGFDGLGNLYVSHSRFGEDTTACLRFDGHQWTARPWDSETLLNSSTQATTLAIDGRGNLFVGGYSFGVDRLESSLSFWAGDLPFYTEFSPHVFERILALTSDGSNNVYVGGICSFLLADGPVAVTDSVAKWDGNEFSALGEGLPNGVRALVTGPVGVVYAGSAFNGVVSRWDGKLWTDLGSRFDGGSEVSINALALDSKGNLYAGGEFGRVGNQPVLGVARWDGSSWSALGTGVNGSVYALAVDAHDTLYVGGYFDHAGAISARGIARWDGQSWSALGSGVSGGVQALGFDPLGNLYAGGTFTRAGTNSVNLSVAKLILHGPLPGQIDITRASDGTNLLSFLGTPGVTYALDLATNLSAPVQWLARATNSAATDSAASAGRVAFTNEIRLHDAFFRVRSVP